MKREHILTELEKAQKAAALVEKKIKDKELVNAIINGKPCQIYVMPEKALQLKGEAVIYDCPNFIFAKTNFNPRKVR
jgi:hypothetical protein